MLDGKVIGVYAATPRAREFLRFLKRIDQETPADFDLHLIVDNYATHKTPAVKRWLKAHRRFHFHFTALPNPGSTRSSDFFAAITGNRIRRGVFRASPAWRRQL